MKIHEEDHSKIAFLCASAPQREAAFLLARGGAEAEKGKVSFSPLGCHHQTFMPLHALHGKTEKRDSQQYLHLTFGEPIPFSEFTLGIRPSVG